MALALVASAFSAGAASAQLASNPFRVDFPSRPVGTISPTVTLTITSVGTGPVRVGQIQDPEGPFALAFDRCSGTLLPPIQECHVGVRFEPSGAPGEASGALEIPSDGPESPLVVPLTGRSVAAETYFPSLMWWSRPLNGVPSLARARTDGTDVVQALIDVDYDPFAAQDTAQSAQHVFWIGPDALGRAEHGEMGYREASFIPGEVSSVAVSAQHVFLAGDGRIGRANLDGSNIDWNFITGLEPPGSLRFLTGLAVAGGKLYWSAYGSTPTGGTQVSEIGRANLDGSGVERSFIPSAIFCSSPQVPMVCEVTDVAVSDEHVYWAWSRCAGQCRSGIGRANLDGTGIEQEWFARTDEVSRPATVAGSLAVDSDWLYFTSLGEGGTGVPGIARMRLDGSDLTFGFIRDPNVRDGLSVSPPGAGVLDVSPEDGARRAVPGASPSVTFSEPLDTASVASAFTLTNTSTGQRVAGRVEAEGAAGYRFVPASALSAGATYRATISTAARTADDGTPLANPVTWTFTVDDLRPDVDFVYPQAGTAAPTDTPMVVAFDQDMAAAATQQAFSLTGPGGAAIGGSFAWYGPRVLVFFPSQPLATGGPYTTRVSTSARSAAGLPLDEAHSSSFTVLDPVRLVGVWPEDGATGVSPTTPVLALFNSRMNPTSGPFVLVRTSDGQRVEFTFSWWNERAAFIVPNTPLEPNTSYTARVLPATDVLGRQLTNPTTWHFTTGDAGTAPQAASSLTLSAPPAEGPQPRALAARQRALRDAPAAVRRLLDPDTLLRLDPRLDGLEKRMTKLTARRAGRS